jgi:transcriptional regulator with XRE-family HTH domain
VRVEIGSAIRAARLAAGLPLKDVSAAVGKSVSWLSRMERGLVRSVSVDELILIGASVGIKLWVTTYPSARAIRDAPQLALLRRFRARIGDGWRWSYEVIVPIARDQRAADAVIRNESAVVMVEAFTRFTDAQGQLRAVLLKARDLGMERIVIVVAATHANRKALAVAADVLASDFPLDTRAVLRALEAGRDPGANGVALV